ncbi:neutrophil cytosol factor 2-like [Biomphalaria glabrata]|uniref:Neutrophil cytosol factor 2-like n=1 Tax=Biomphalaria glabrata TaxID=6526 RepID=A0A9W3BEH0_BIOGL|nr:neutrophil cytosol factor 2-like [Biomphalaria glabrata]XP_055897867.1 neutrophil cytosol factor 2-like [Biomphalaria glabrata]
MSLKGIIQTWHQACCHFDKLQLPEALLKFQAIDSPTAKILHNIGCIHMLQKSYAEAVKSFQESTEKDHHLALSYFTMGLCYHHSQRYAEAAASFNEARSLIKGTEINYKQIGAPVVLSSKLVDECLHVSKESQSKKKHCQLPIVAISDCLFRPPRSMVDNLVKQDFLGKAKIVASTDSKDAIGAATQQSAVQPSSTQSMSHSSPGLIKKDITNIPRPPSRPPPRYPHHKGDSTKSIRATDQRKEDLNQSHLNKTHYQTPSESHNVDLGKVVPVPYLVTRFQTTPDGSVDTAFPAYSVPNRPIPDTPTDIKIQKNFLASPYLVTDLSKFLSPSGQLETRVTLERSSSAVSGQPRSRLVEKGTVSSYQQPVKKPTRPPPPRTGFHSE